MAFRRGRPMAAAHELKAAPWLDFTSGDVKRGMAKFPKQGEIKPWKVHQNYALDLLEFRYGRVDDGVMRFSKQTPAAAATCVRALETV